MCAQPPEYFTNKAFFERNKYLLKPIKERFPNADVNINGPYDVEYEESIASNDAAKVYFEEFVYKLAEILANCKTERAFKIQFNRWKKYLKENEHLGFVMTYT